MNNREMACGHAAETKRVTMEAEEAVQIDHFLARDIDAGRRRITGLRREGLTMFSPSAAPR